MARVKFVRDLWWLNTSDVTDDGALTSSVANNLCLKLNNVAGYLGFAAGDISFYTRLEATELVPEKLRIQADIAISTSSDLSIYVNDVEVYTHTFASSTTIDETVTLTTLQLEAALNSRGDTVYDQVKIRINGSAPKTLNYLYVYFESDTSATYNNHQSVSSPTIKYAYPSLINSENWETDDLVSGTNYDPQIAYPTNSAGNDSNYIQQKEGIVVSSPTLDLTFNLSGTYSNPTQIQRAFLNFRYNQSGTLSTARTDSCFAYVTSNIIDPDAPVMWGKGFTIEPSSSGYLVGSIPMYFVKNGKSDRFYDSSIFYDEFDVKLTGLPSGVKISAMEMLLYNEPDNFLCMHTLNRVSHTVEKKYPVNDTALVTSGKNRFKAVNSDSVFDYGYWSFNPSGLASNTNVSGYLDSTPSYWDNYYNSRIDSHRTHNNAYYNAILLNNNKLTLSGINIGNNFSLLISLSSKGSGYNYFGNTGNVLTKYSNTNDREFEVNCLGNIFEVVVYNVSGMYDSFELPASSNNQILLTNLNVSGTHLLKGYWSDGDGPFTYYNELSTPRNGTAGNIVMFSGFYGYLHELGISNNVIDVDSFNKTRHNYYEYLRGSGIQLNIPNHSGSFNDDYYLLFLKPSAHNSGFYQMNTPQVFAYNTLVTNPSGIYIDIDYECTTTNPSGIGLSGIHFNGFNESFNSFALNFATQFPSGVGSKRVYPTNLQEDYLFINNFPYASEYTRLSVHNENISGSGYFTHNLKIKSFSISYDAWQIVPTGINTLNLVTLGGQRPSESLDFFVKNQLLSSGLDFYQSAKTGMSGYLNFFTGSSLLSSGTFTGYVNGNYINNDGINFFIEGTTPIEFASGVNFYQYAANNSGLFNTIPFSVTSELDDDNSINFYIGSSLEENEDSINFYISSDAVYNKSVEMYMPNNISGVDYSVKFFTPVSNSGYVSYINMNINGFGAGSGVGIGDMIVGSTFIVG